MESLWTTRASLGSARCGHQCAKFAQPRLLASPSSSRALEDELAHLPKASLTPHLLQQQNDPYSSVRLAHRGAMQWLCYSSVASGYHPTCSNA